VENTPKNSIAREIGVPALDKTSRFEAISDIQTRLGNILPKDIIFIDQRVYTDNCIIFPEAWSYDDSKAVLACYGSRKVIKQELVAMK